MKQFPYALIPFRFLSAPVMLCLGYFYHTQYTTLIIVLLFIGLLSDKLDGSIARKQNVSSAKMRRPDSQTDIIFWLAAGFINDVYSDGTNELCMLLTNLKNKKSGRSHQDIFLFYGKTSGLSANTSS